MNNERYILFSGTMKMADMIWRNYGLLNLLPRFDILLGFGEKSVDEVCRQRGVDNIFFLMICNIHTFDGYFPSKEELKTIDIVGLIDYLKRSHNYYTERKMASIEEKLRLITDCETTHYQVIQRFFEEYKQEVVGHFEYEDQTVFPYVLRLVEGTATVDYHIKQYEENHSNIDDKLSDLKNIILKYLPESFSSEARNEILTDLFSFEEDLVKHTRIEDKILIPYVQTIEKEYEKA